MSGSAKGARRLIVVADDFGASASVNAAVLEAHDRGAVTAASLMAGGEAFEEAVAIAKERPGLSVGLHLTFCDGRAVLPRAEIPDLVGADGRFEPNDARAGLRYWTRRRALGPQLRAETRAQFDRMEAAGLRPTHVDGHHHLHMHPVLFGLACEEAARRGVRWVRLPNEPLSVVASFGDRARGPMPWIEWAVFRALGVRARRVAAARGLRWAERVYGLARTGKADAAYFVALAALLDAPLCECYAHPDLGTEAGKRELEALCAPEVLRALNRAGVSRVGYAEAEGERR